MANVHLSIPARHKAGHSKVYHLVTGARGGQRWECTQIIHTAGVEYPDAEFAPGEWKITQWVNSIPRIIYHFRVTEDGQVVHLL